MPVYIIAIISTLTPEYECMCVLMYVPSVYKGQWDEDRRAG